MNPEPFATVIDRWAGEIPDHPALVTASGSISYSELERRIRRAVEALRQAGIEQGDRVAVCAMNRVELLELLFACCRLDAMLFVINNRLTAAEMSVQLANCRPAVVLSEDRFGQTVGEAAPTCQDLEEFLAAVDVPATNASLERPAVSQQQGENLDVGALLVYTSGTTGAPKGAILTKRSLLYTALNGVAHEGFDQRSVTVAVLPMFHVGGLNVQLVPTLLAGGTVVLEERFDPDRLLDLMDIHRPSHMLLVPAVMQAVLDRAAALDISIRERFATLGAMNCGSSIVPVELIERFVSNDVAVVQVYGATETGPTAIVLAYEHADRLGSCGGPAAHTELRIETPSGQTAEAGEVGELLLRGPNLFVGYWEDEEATADAFTDGWYRTGDLGYIDADGFTYVTGRTKEMIISGGENIYPAEVEQCIEQHPSIEAAAVIAKPSERWGESPVAFVVTVGGEAVGKAELASWTRERLAGFKQPHEWIFVDSFARTSLGKIQKHKLLSQLETDQPSA